MVEIILQLPWRMRGVNAVSMVGKFLFKEEFHEVANHVFKDCLQGGMLSPTSHDKFSIFYVGAPASGLTKCWEWFTLGGESPRMTDHWGANKPLHIITVSKVNSLDRFLTFAILQWWNDAMMKQVTLIWSHLQTRRHWVVIVMLISGGQCYKHSVDDLLSALIYTIQGVARRD